jgi:hypothetical protein
VSRNTDELIENILKRQNKDGGWSYTRGASWTEPSLYAALVLKASSADRSAVDRALQWTRNQQRRDGGFSPYGSVEQSTWVTSLVLLFSPEDLGSQTYRSALDWVLRQRGRETSFLYRLQLRMNSQEDRYQVSGWPWFTGAASWVSPTSAAILGLRRAQLYFRDESISKRLEEGRKFLVTHTCQDGGWNHGSDRALGYSAESYPETTGAALLALRGVPKAQLSASIGRARAMAETCSFSEGSSWLRMGLAAHGETVASMPASGKARNLRDECLEVLSDKVTGGAVEL